MRFLSFRLVQRSRFEIRLVLALIIARLSLSVCLLESVEMVHCLTPNEAAAPLAAPLILVRQEQVQHSKHAACFTRQLVV